MFQLKRRLLQRDDYQDEFPYHPVVIGGMSGGGVGLKSTDCKEIREFL
jgi:hypothetical protein